MALPRRALPSLCLLSVALAAGCTSVRAKYLGRTDISAEERAAVARKRVILGMDVMGVGAAIGAPCTKRTITTLESEETVWQFCKKCPGSAFGGGGRCINPKTITFIGGKVVKAEQ